MIQYKSSARGDVTHASYRLRFYPSAAQAALLTQQFGARRFIYNQGIAYAQAHAINGKAPNIAGFSAEITQMKKLDAFQWMNTIPVVVFQQSIRDLDSAFKRYYAQFKLKQNAGKIKMRKDGKMGGYPRFKSRRDSLQSFRVTLDGRLSHTFQWEGDISLPSARYGEDFPTIRPSQVRWTQAAPYVGAKPKMITLSRDATFKYWISFMIEIPMPPPLAKTKQAVGVDLGIKSFFTLSTGEQTGSLKPFRQQQAKLAHLQRTMNRRFTKGVISQSKRYAKAKLAVAKQHQHVSNIRKDIQHKLSSELVCRFDIIAIEDLNVRGMMANHRLAKSIQDAAFFQFRTELTYKCVRAGRELRVINRWEPTSKTCSSCGQYHADLTLAMRTLTCDCGLTLDRDINAAINILRVGLRDMVDFGYLPTDHSY